MNKLGTIIRHFRSVNHMTREQLADGICTPKYLYLIEKGERTPSNSVLAKLGERMSLSLFEYYNYLECDDPIKVKNIMDDFFLHRKCFDYEWLMKYQGVTDNVADFKRMPWRFEKELNKSMLKLILEGNPAETAMDILNTIADMPPAYRYSVCHLRQLILLSICYLESGKMKAANFTIEQVRSVIKNKLDCIEFQHLFLMSAHIHIVLKLKTNEPAAAVVIADELMQQQNSISIYDFHHFTLLLKGCALIKLGKKQEARSSIRRGLLLLLVFDKSRDLAYLNHIGILQEILKSGLIEERLLEEIKNKYHV